jgi:site-specific recombinase XerD
MTNALTIVSATLQLINNEIARSPRLKSEETRRAYRHDLARFEVWRAGRTLTKLLVEQYAAELQHEGKSPATINRKLAAVRWWARRLSDLAFEDSALTRDERDEVSTQAARVAVVEDVGGSRVRTGREVTQGELSALMSACAADPSAAGVRDAALMALAWSTGARRSELAGLTIADIQWIDDESADLVIKGKGDKERKVFIYNGAAQALKDWLAIRSNGAGLVFVSITKGGKVQTGERLTGIKAEALPQSKAAGLSDEALAQMLEKRRQAARLTQHLTWHDFRRTFAGTLLDNGADLVTVQKLMGHASPVTTSNYDRRGDETKRKALKALHVPYRKR